MTLGGREHADGGVGGCCTDPPVGDEDPGLEEGAELVVGQQLVRGRLP
jgi:hypothetical protein